MPKAKAIKTPKVFFPPLPRLPRAQAHARGLSGSHSDACAMHPAHRHTRTLVLGRSSHWRLNKGQDH